MKIVFHGIAAATFGKGIEEDINHTVTTRILSPDLDGEGEVEAYQEADIIVGGGLGANQPKLTSVQLYQTNGAGWNSVNPDYLPEGVPLCNCHGHPEPIAEYVMAGLLMFRIPIIEDDALLRKGDWNTRPDRPRAPHGELFGSTLGILGFGQIGKDIAKRAQAFGMKIHIANRSDVSDHPLVDAYYPLDKIGDFCASVDAVAAAAPLTSETEGLLGVDAFARMRPHAIVVNVGRGHVIDEQALYDALKEKRIAGALIDTWYVYPKGEENADSTLPSNLPFQDLDNVLMTPHMSGWVPGMFVRRRKQIADNINRLIEGKPVVNCVAQGTGTA